MLRLEQEDALSAMLPTGFSALSFKAFGEKYAKAVSGEPVYNPLHVDDMPSRVLRVVAEGEVVQGTHVNNLGATALKSA